MTAPSVHDVRFEHRRLGDALGIDAPAPRLSWITRTDTPWWRQAAYEMEIRDERGEEIASSGRVASAESVLVPWPGAPMSSREVRLVRVRVWGEDGEGSSWSEPARVEAALLQPKDWTARFVGASDAAADDGPMPLVRREFDLPASIARARLYVSALGLYEVEVNGRRVGDHVLAPGWTSYRKRLHYETFDVTDLVRSGPNAIGGWLADGWYRGPIGFVRQQKHVWGDRLALLAQLEVQQEDGSSVVIGTDGEWSWAPGPIVSSDIFGGEVFDARLVPAGWSEVGGGGDAWTPVAEIERDLSTLDTRVGPPVRRTELVPPQRIDRSPSGTTIVDFGQNLGGRLRLTVDGPRGTTITLRHAELLKDGELERGNLTHAEATDAFTLAGDGPETWEPRFTFHGFRFAEIDGWPGEIAADDVVAVACHTDMERTGWFECSDERVNQLHRNIVWTMRSTFMDVPIDCPQRHERLGWMGDPAVFAGTGCFIYDDAGFLVSWLIDAANDQLPDGRVAIIVPSLWKDQAVTCAIWADTAVVLPWVVYQRFGDRGVLEAQYPSMRAYVELLIGLARPDRLITDGDHFGDWLDPGSAYGQVSATDQHLLANAWYCRSFDIMASTAALLGLGDDAARYRAVATEIRRGFAAEYVTPNGRLSSDTQGAYATALRFGMITDAGQRAGSERRLGELVEIMEDRLTTGFPTTMVLLDALCDAGNSAAAYRLLLQERCPSWLFMLTLDATTIWEHWTVLMPDGTLGDLFPESQSLNHVAMGSVGDWLHRRVAGLAPATPGYRHIEIRPIPGEGLDWASARHRTPYGLAESSWRIEDGRIEVRATIPPNTSATVHLPGSEDAPIEVGSGSHEWRYPFPRDGAVTPAPPPS